MKNAVKLQYRLIVSYLVIILIPLIALGSVSFFVSLSIVRNQTVDQDQTYIRQISTNVDSVIAHMKSTSLIAYSSTLLQQYIREENIDNLELKGDANIHNYLYSLKSADYDNYTFILKSYTTGSIYCNNYDYQIDTTYDYDALHWVQNAITLNDATVFVPTYVPDYFNNNQDPVFSIVRQLNNNFTLTPLGYIIINCDVRVIDDIVGGDGTYVFITDQYDRLIYPYNHQSPPELSQTENGDIQTINGEKFLVSQFTSPDSGLNYVKITPYSTISRNSTLIIQMTLLTIVITVLLSLMLSFPLSQSVSTPINRLILNMNSVNKDGFKESELTTNISEIQELNRRFNKMMRRINTYIQDEYLSKIRKKDMDYKLLQSQISPHFLFNTLESIRMMAALNDDPETAKMIYNLANLYRYSIRITESLVPLERELDHISNYVELQKMRFGDKFQYEVDIDPKSLNCQLPQLSLQPLIENALSHGFATVDRGGIIKLTSHFHDQNLKIIIDDNGSGMDPITLSQLQSQLSKNENQGHIGLLATFERIKYHFTDSDVTIDSQEGLGTRVVIHIHYT